MESGVVQVDVHLTGVGMREPPELQVEDDQTAQAAVEEQEIHPIPLVVDPEAALSAAQRAVALNSGEDANMLETLALAFQMTGNLAQAAGSVQPDQIDDLRACLYGLYALLRLHFLQEEENYFTLADPERPDTVKDEHPPGRVPGAPR